ncbi:MAG: hypothetical protein HYY18_11830 [Planctomycetes bacterium]|nr:hypothetical protein [Planctomycetota bacterium]
MIRWGIGLGLLLILVPDAPAREVASSAPRPGQKPVNDGVNALLTRTRDEAIREAWKKSPGDTEKVLVAVYKAFVFPLRNRSVAAVERALERDPEIAAELNYGTLPEKERVDHTVFAPSLLVRKENIDIAVGLDKFGHFFEEGFFCRQVAAEGGEARALGMSRWLEGLAPDEESVAWIRRTRKLKLWWVDEDGKRDHDLVGAFGAHAAGKATGVERGSSPADIEANLAGMRWFADLEALLRKAPKDAAGLEKLLRDNPVRIEAIVTEAWDEARNPNVKTLEQAPR